MVTVSISTLCALMHTRLVECFGHPTDDEYKTQWSIPRPHHKANIHVLIPHESAAEGVIWIFDPADPNESAFHEVLQSSEQVEEIIMLLQERAAAT